MKDIRAGREGEKLGEKNLDENLEAGSSCPRARACPCQYEQLNHPDNGGYLP